MTNENVTDLTDPDPRTRAWDLIRRGVELVDSGDHDAAVEHFLNAESLAMDAGLDDLVRVSLINQGHAYSTCGDAAKATERFEQAIELARSAADRDRLALALANLGAVLKGQGRHEDVVAALTEYLDLSTDGDPAARARAHLERADSLIELRDYEHALTDIGQADLLAAGTDDRGLRHSVVMSRANIYTRFGDPGAARVVLERALEAARAREDTYDMEQVLAALAQVCRLTGQYRRAEELFTEVEDRCRVSEDTATLADSLYWHGVMCASARQNDSALALWREEEAIRRELGDDGYLAECLAAQAEALRGEGQHDAADPLFFEAIELAERLNRPEDSCRLLYSYGLSLRAAGKSGEALARADEALLTAAAVNDPKTQRRSQSLRAMALADLGEIDEAYEALDATESLCVEGEDGSATVWRLARRAYVAACAGGEPDEVVSHLRKAHEHALLVGRAKTGRNVARKMAREIGTRCGETHDEALRDFLRVQREEIDTARAADVPLDRLVPLDDEEDLDTLPEDE